MKRNGGGKGGGNISYLLRPPHVLFRMALAIVSGLIAVALHLCGRRRLLEADPTPEEVLVTVPTVHVEEEEGDEAPSTPSTGGGHNNDDPPPYVRRILYTLHYKSYIYDIKGSQNTCLNSF